MPVAHRVAATRSVQLAAPVVAAHLAHPMAKLVSLVDTVFHRLVENPVLVLVLVMVLALARVLTLANLLEAMSVEVPTVGDQSEVLAASSHRDQEQAAQQALTWVAVVPGKPTSLCHQ